MQRLWNNEVLRSLLDGREQVIEESMRSDKRRRASVRRKPVPEEASVEESRPRGKAPAPPLPASVRSTQKSELRRLLSSRRLLRQAIIAQEVLGPPKAFRP